MEINWGIIGCGDVTEMKSGPAFNKVPGSKLVAVMRRDPAKAKDYSERHKVPHWYSDVKLLLQHPGINAIYIATPPSSHEQLALEAIAAGKHVYLEKPMAMNHYAAERIAVAATKKGVKLSIAHYRRQQPIFLKMRELIRQNILGKIQKVNLSYYRKQISKDELKVPKTAWRHNPVISGGGLFHDLAPHQIDLLIYFFGNPAHSSGNSRNSGKVTEADDTVAGNMIYDNGIMIHGDWNFNGSEGCEKDEISISGSDATLDFKVFQHQIFTIKRGSDIETYMFDPLQHVQQPMIAAVVSYFQGSGENPCPPEAGIEVMRIMDSFIGNS